MIDIEQWPRVEFGDVVRQVKDKVDANYSGLDRYIAGEHMDTDDLRIRRWGEINGDYLGPAFQMRFKPGQVLYGSRRTYLRKVAVADFEGICANTTFVLEPKDPTVLLPELLPFIMQTEAFHDHSIKQSKGSVNPYINFSDLDWYEFALPPLEEQRRVAEKLTGIEHVLDATRDLESTTESLRKALIVDSFARLATDMNVSWVKVPDAGEVLMGRQRSPQYDRGILPTPYLRVANIYDGFIDTTDVKQMDFSHIEFEKYRLRNGDVLLVEGHSSAEVVGRSSIFREEILDCCFQNTLIRFRPIKTSSEFAHYYFRYCLYSRQFSAVAKQTTIAHLGSNRFSKMRFPIMSRRQEEQIVDNLLNVEQNLQLATQRREAAQRLKHQTLQTVAFPVI